MAIRILFLSLLVFGLFGCGGGGGGKNNGSNPLAQRYQALLNDAENEDLDDAMSNYSFDFLNDCEDYDDVENGLDGQFSTPNYSIDFRDLDVTFWEIDGNLGYAEGTVRVIETLDGDVEDDVLNFEMYFRRENGVWLLYGDQLCLAPVAPLAGKTTPITEQLGLKKKG